MCHNEDCIALFSWRHELQIARSIQQSLLPKVRPQIRGFEVEGWSQTADDTGGDFYDWKKLPDGRS
jgi:serine phosphatase RsbU (regulator of sigma subunit)